MGTIENNAGDNTNNSGKSNVKTICKNKRLVYVDLIIVNTT